MGHETIRINPSKCGCCTQLVGLINSNGEFGCGCVLTDLFSGHENMGAGIAWVKGLCVVHNKHGVITYINDGQEESPW